MNLRFGAVVFAMMAALFCGRAEAQGVLNIYNWNDYIDEQTLKRFEAETGIKVRYDVYDSNEALDAKLRAGRSGYDLVAPSASPFLALQVPAKLYQTLARSQPPNYPNPDQ